MTLKEWLRDVVYDDFTRYLINGETKIGKEKVIGQVHNIYALRKCFSNFQESEKFQDEVGRFIAEAINEKIKRDYGD